MNQGHRDTDHTRALVLRALGELKRIDETLRAVLDALPGPEQLDAPVDLLALRLRQQCHELGIHILDNRRVKEADAARLICRAYKTMMNWRQNGDDKIPYKKINNK